MISFNSEYYEKVIGLDSELQKVLFSIYTKVADRKKFIPEVNSPEEINVSTYDHVAYHVENFGETYEGYSEVEHLWGLDKSIKKMVEVAEKLGWAVTINGNDIMFSKFSPAGQDFNVEITADSLEEIIEKIEERCENFDCSEETYIWLDNSGHGTNGAPYDMKDLYEDMEACLEMMKELCSELEEVDVE